VALGAGASRCGRLTRPPHLPDRPAAETMDGGSAIDEVVKRLPLDDVEAMLSRRGLPSVVHRGAPRRARGLLAAALKDGMCEWTCEAGVQDGYHDRELGRGVAARRGGTPQPAAEPRAEPSSRPPPAIASVHCSLHVIGDSIFAFGSSDKHQDQFTVGGGTSPPATAVSAPCAPDKCDRPSPCMGHFAVAHDGRLYVFPVHPGSQSGPAWAFDPATESWHVLQTRGMGPNCALIPKQTCDGKFYAVSRGLGAVHEFCFDPGPGARVAGTWCRLDVEGAATHDTC